MITEAHLDILRHATGLDRSKEAYRNYFCADEHHSDMPLINDLVAAGLMRAARKINDGRDTIYIVTQAGASKIIPPHEGREP